MTNENANSEPFRLLVFVEGEVDSEGNSDQVVTSNGQVCRRLLNVKPPDYTLSLGLQRFKEEADEDDGQNLEQ